jgi:hypothetical protein
MRRGFQTFQSRAARAISERSEHRTRELNSVIHTGLQAGDETVSLRSRFNGFRRRTRTFPRLDPFDFAQGRLISPYQHFLLRRGRVS